MLGLFSDERRVTVSERDGPSSTHVSTLASSGESNSNPEGGWGKRSPLKTYSKKSLPTPTVSPTPKEDDSEGKSRYGRTRKIRTSGDFYSTDRRVGNYLKVEEKNQLFNFRFAYSNPKSLTRKPGKNSNLCRSISVGSLLPIEKNEGSSAVSSGLDLAAPTSPETLETPLALQEPEYESKESEIPVAPTDYMLGDMAWAAIPPHPYWPAIITRDPITNSAWKARCHGSSRCRVYLWHVHFFGDKGMRGWVSTINMFPFRGMESYTSFQNELPISYPQLNQTQKKAVKQRLKLFCVKETFKLVWSTAVSEAESLLSCTREERLEYFNDTYNVYQVNKRSRSLSCDDLSYVVKKARQSLQVKRTGSHPIPKKRKSEPVVMQETVSGITPLGSDAGKTKPEPVQASHSELTTTPSKPMNKSLLQSPKVKKRLSLKTPPSTPGIHSLRSQSSSSNSPPKTKSDPLTDESSPVATVVREARPRRSKTTATVGEITQPTNAVDSFHDGESDLTTPEKPADKKKSVESRAAQTSPIQLLPLVVKSAVMTKTPNGSSLLKGVFVTSVLKNMIEEGKIVEIPSMANSNSEPIVKRRRGRPRKYWPIHLINSQAQINSRKMISLEDGRENVVPSETPPQESSCLNSVSPTPDSCDLTESLPLKRKSRRRGTSLPCIPGITPLTHLRSRNRSVKQSSSLASDDITPLVDHTPSSNSLLVHGNVSIKNEPPTPRRATSRKSIQSPKPSPSLSLKTHRKKSTKPADESDKRPPAKRPKIEPLSPPTSEGAQSSVDVSIKENFSMLNKGAIKNEHSTKNHQQRKTCLFSGIKEGKVCSICLKGENVVRCRGPCSTYMHIECASEPVHSGPPILLKSETPLPVSNNTITKSPVVLSKKIFGFSAYNSWKRYKKAAKTNLDQADETAPTGAVLTYTEFLKNEELLKSFLFRTNENCYSRQNGGEDSISNTPNRRHSLTMASPGWGAEIANSNDNDNLTAHSGGEDPTTNIDQQFQVETGGTTDSQTVNGNENLELQLNESSTFPVSSGMPTPPPEEAPKSPEGPVCINTVENKEPDNVVSLNQNSLEPAEVEEKTNGSAVKKEGKDKGWWCNMCLEGVLGPCYVCGKDEGERIRCKIYYCGKVFHLKCVKEWPQHTLKQSSKGKMMLYCPAHTCHTCISDNPASLTSRYLNDKLVRCVRCPTTYHYGNYCVPAGSEVLTPTQIICPRHFREGKKSLSLINASWCFLCSIGGSLICCDLCPHAFHVECLRIAPPEGSYICEDCETGRYPLYGEVVWAKLGRYRWWPARILFPQEIPPRLLKTEHVPGEFVVRFYGTYNYYWLNRGRVFLFHEGDGKKQESISLLSKKSYKDGVFNTGVREANEDFLIWTEERNCREESQRPSMKPPSYVKITSNKPVGSVKMNEADASSLTACDCKPDQKDPCGIESDCINRLLMVECSPQICPAGEKCNNQNFEKKKYPALMPFRTESRGWGLKTVAPLKKGDFVIEYVGEMIDDEEYKRRLEEMQKSKDENFYFLILDKDRILDAGPKGNLARFMNHSCQPNCETQKWTVEGDMRVGLFTLQDIPADSELVFNYNLMTTGDSKLECRCRAPNCAGFIGGKPTKPSLPPPHSANGKLKITSATKKKKQRRASRKDKLARSVLLKSTNNSVQTKLGNGVNSSNGNGKDEENKCFACHNPYPSLTCQDLQCFKMYHLACLGLTKDPSKRWTCPCHECSICSSRSKVENCSLCINSYCSEHQEGNIVLNRGKGGSHCHNHNMSDSGSDWSTEDKEEDVTESSAKSPTPVNNT